MAVDYDELRETAEEIIEDWGSSGQVIVKGKKGGKSVSGDAEADTPDTFIDGIFTPLVKFKTHEVDGKSVLMGDSYVLWQTTGDEKIKVNMQITINSVTFVIKAIMPLSSNEDINVYIKLHLRNG